MVVEGLGSHRGEDVSGTLLLLFGVALTLSMLLAAHVALHRVPSPTGELQIQAVAAPPHPDVDALVALVAQEWARGEVLAAIVNSHRMLVWEVDEDGLILLYKGRAALEPFGLTPEQMEGSNLFRDWSSDTDSGDAVRKAFASGEPVDWYTQPQDITGGAVWWGRAVPIKHGDKPVVRVVGHTLEVADVEPP